MVASASARSSSRALGADAIGCLELIDLDLVVEQLLDRVGGLA
jgi:hypothetical protein